MKQPPSRAWLVTVALAALAALGLTGGGWWLLAVAGLVVMLLFLQTWAQRRGG
jgi:hypothetical protein